MHEIVDQPGVTAQRDAAARRLQIGLRSDRVLLIAELVADIGNQFGKRNADIRFACSSPRGHKLIQPVQHDAAERAIILRQVVDRRRSRQIRRAVGRWRSAIEIRTALHFERKRHLRELRIEARESLGDIERVFRSRAGVVHQPQQVR